ncbi:DNA-binding domain-containing protein [Granulicella sp. S190]|uniref:HvfC/BufC N-terminal domain-containing protein n=1 Tax=Granulicella sp. S190 TaxID=1747226 RepID=UPI00131DC469|nr:DNA-binding domain-containing protein [Granulicella sp. S190]
MNLLELQRRMAQDVMRPLTSDFQMQPATADGSSTADLANTYIKPNDRLSSFERLEIYNRQYWFRVTGAVAEDFPAVGAVLGEKKFDNLVLAYLSENPSTSFTLRNLGSKLPKWLESHPEFSPRRHDLLLDIARLEWAYVEAFDGADLLPLTAADFGDLGAESQLFLQPHIQLLDLRYPVDELVLAVHRQTEPSDIMSNAVTERKQIKRARLPRMVRSQIHLAVHRYENSVYYRRVDHEAFRLLSALQGGTALGPALEVAFGESSFSPEEQAAKIQEYFAHASELGWFCKPQAG